MRSAGGEPVSQVEQKANQAEQAQANAQLQQQMAQYYKLAQGDLQSGNYAGALQAGLDSGKLYHTGYDSQTTDPLLLMLESSQGLKQLAPGVNWTPDSINQYYKAFGANNVSTGQQAGTSNAGESWGKNAYGSWGDPTKISQDAQTNISTGGDNSAPDLMRFAGVKPTENTFQKWGEPIINAALAVWAPYLLPAATVAEGVGKGQSGWGLAENAAISAAGSYVGASGVGDIASAGLGDVLGTGVNAVTNAAGGAIVSGAAGAGLGAAGAALQGRNVGQGALLGGVNGAISGGVSGSGIGDGSQMSSALTNTGTSAFKGAVDASITGGSAAQGALGGALKAGSGAVAGSILSGAGTIFNSGSTDVQTQNPNLTNPASSNTHMADDTGAFDPNYFDPSQQTALPMDGVYNPQTDPNSGAFNGTVDPTNQYGGDANPYMQQLLGGVDPNYQSNYLNEHGGVDPTGGSSGGGSNLGSLGAIAGGLLHGGSGQATAGKTGNGTPAGGNAGMLSSLASMLGMGQGGAGALASLLGLGATGAGTYLNSSAAKGAASDFANQAKYNPYGVSGVDGSTSFANGQATSNLSPGAQSTVNGLQGLNQSTIAQLQQGPQAYADQNFNALTSSQLQGQQRLVGNTQDNEFANGVLGSTAGGYQTQAAMNAIGNQISGDRVTANNMAQTQQQQQLSQLTGGLNGMNQIAQNQNQQASLGGTLGSDQSSANNYAYQPSLAANSNTPTGQLLTSLGGSLGGGANSNLLSNWLTGNGNGTGP